MHSLLSLQEPLACDLVTIHNIHYQVMLLYIELLSNGLVQLNLMKELRKSIEERKLPQFVQRFMDTLYPARDYPQWSIDALRTVNIIL